MFASSSAASLTLWFMGGTVEPEEVRFSKKDSSKVILEMEALQGEIACF